MRRKSEAEAAKGADAKRSATSGRKIRKLPPLRLVIVECSSEQNQQETESRLREMGIGCSLRVL